MLLQNTSLKLQPRGSSLLPHTKVFFFLFQAYTVLPDLHLYGPKQSIEFCDSYERC